LFSGSQFIVVDSAFVVENGQKSLSVVQSWNFRFQMHIIWLIIACRKYSNQTILSLKQETRIQSMRAEY